MGPRFFNRGKQAGLQHVGHLVPRFNGASVFQPRKVEYHKMRSLSESRFNGASVFQPRKDRRSLPRQGVGSGLQWGLGFSTEERAMTFGKFKDQPMLQWGLGFSTEESRGITGDGPVDATASMGPRFFNRGKRPAVE